MVKAENSGVVPGALFKLHRLQCVDVIKHCVCLKSWYQIVCAIYWVKARKLHSNQRNLVAGGQVANPILQVLFLPAAVHPLPEQPTDSATWKLDAVILYEVPTTWQALGWALKFPD